MMCLDIRKTNKCLHSVRGLDTKMTAQVNTMRVCCFMQVQPATQLVHDNRIFVAELGE